ncbi:Zn(II)2Cys6 transcription factor domain-containing protein [Aspergillus ruber CBS 135680]|uniref:Zn(2)-C6 fungal-type domain-containing protein n=1 Tax=Aspergillus ruber (strain CBS 135680) TaxID=1388766 RepID=A0A017S6N3_ASPRC|nr:uncharacterized protein EURHEDRAFT_415707 [Aspergillus ruber CBS 135680]EYE92284.1 hypothetical protein EURHEDRAFT_415707 [Aspergillus ruber CBS 135680]
MSSRVSLRRSCQTCAKLKRRCDQRLPQCNRCAAKGTPCEYINTPWAVGKRSNGPLASVKATSPMNRPLHLEIIKTFDGAIIRFLVDGMRTFPVTFAQQMKTLFIHPDLYRSSSHSGPIQEIHTLCKSYQSDVYSPRLFGILRQKAVQIHRHATHTSSFEELLFCVQALILSHCILAFDDQENSQYSEATSTMLTNMALKLWHQAPIQLPHAMSARRAWLFAESVRRTIIIAYMLCSAYSFRKRSFSVRTPFVDALPFDVRTSMWDESVDSEWEEKARYAPVAMVSLREYSDMLEGGRVHGISFFGSLILAACKGLPAKKVAFPPVQGYREISL